MSEKVNHPNHYGGDVKFEAIKLIDDWGLGFSAGNALKYIIRAPHKGSELEDLRKAVWYLNHAVEIEEGMGFNKFFHAFLHSFGFWPRPARDLNPTEAARYHKLDTRLERALEQLCSHGYSTALSFVTDELMLRENQAARAAQATGEYDKDQHEVAARNADQE